MLVCNKRQLGRPCRKKTCVLNNICPLSACAYTSLLLRVFNYTIGTYSPPYFSLANKASSVPNYYTCQEHFSRATVFKKKNAKVSSRRLYLINRCSQCKVCGRPRGSRAAGREQAPRLAGEALGKAVDSHQPH